MQFGRPVRCARGSFVSRLGSCLHFSALGSRSFAPSVRVWSNAPTSYSSQALDGWEPCPPSWLDASEDGGADEHEHLYTACEGLGGVMLEWSVAFLDRLFEVLRHKGIYCLLLFKISSFGNMQ